MGYNFGVGREAPLFSLTAHDGSTVSLSQYRGDWYPVIVFLRVGAAGIDEYLRELNGVVDELWGVRGQVITVAGADQDQLRQLADRVGDVSFPLLADPEGTVARLYGAWDETARDCLPVACIADRAHKVVWTRNGDGDLPPSVAELTGAFRGFVK